MKISKSNKVTSKKKGNFIENYATAYLMREGYKILARNYGYRGGELDIVAKDKNITVFVEVKSVWNSAKGNPAARVNATKQKKIWQTACHFLQMQQSDLADKFSQPCRFDVLSAKVYQRPLSFNHIKNAFEGNRVIPEC